MKVLITGGHFSPAYSVIQELIHRGDEVVIVGRKHPFEGDKQSYSYEYRVSKEFKIPFVELSTGRLQRKFTRHTLISLMKFLKSFSSALSIIHSQNPDIVLTFGGYLALPVAVVARFKNIPIVTHEQTQGLGLSNGLIAKIADTVCISFASSQKKISGKHVVLTGNPIRPEIYAVQDKVAHPPALPVIYVTGGSTGSHSINMGIKEVLPELLQQFVIIHQTGENEFQDFENLTECRSLLAPELAKRYVIKKYIYPSEIGYIYKTADMVIGRSGANTVLELIACNKPSILIPLPHGQKGEQAQNAQLIESLGLGIMIEQHNLTAAILLDAIREMMKGLEKYNIAQDIIEKYIFNDAAHRIVHELTVQYEKKKKN
jgi:UDP-N-acetylglucosamine--N-acetylmuramyl-(pentapeptide) pyrophosphoryl-undecaprenol N-acetylglucosamine transferase